MRFFKSFFLLTLLFLCWIPTVSAQPKYTLRGSVRDKATGEELIGATLLVKELRNIGTISNEYGFYSITLPKGTYTIAASFVGYETMLQNVVLDKDQKIDVLLEPTAALQEVVISGEKPDENVTRAQMGVERLDVKDIGKLPVLFGEKDVLKTIQMLPGVKSAGEGNSGFYVRGGSADQNLILLDEANVYNASHLLGFFSTFNSDAIKDATLYKGNTPAQYGGRLASVLDIKMNEGNDKSYHVAGGIGLISSRLSVEGPIQKEKSSFLVTARRTYADVFLKLTEDYKDNSLYFYDFNAKANLRINDNNRLFLSGYFGRDNLGFGDQFGIDWGNTTGTLRWNHVVNPKLFGNTSLIYSDYNYDINISGGGSSFFIKSQIQDWNLKHEFQYFPSTKHSWRFGINSIYHTITPSRFQSADGSIGASDSKAPKYAWENALYINDSATLSPKLNLDYGLRASSYSILGSGSYNVYTQGVLTGKKTLETGKIGKTYFNIEPRLSLSYKLNPASSLKAAYSRNTQNLHLLSNSTSTSPTDQWVGNSYTTMPEVADQVSVGYFRNFADNAYEMSAESYFKDMQNQVDYKNGADINTAPDVESELLFGRGRAYGLELFLKKKTGKFTGWVSYTLSRTERKIEGINEGNWYAAKQDRTHDLSLVGMYQLSQKWSIASNFVYYTGNAVTFPSGKYSVLEQTTYLYTERNGYRMPSYHRLDLSANYERMQKGRLQSSWNFSVYNVYGRKNAYTITFEDNPDDPTRTQAVRTALFRWVPSITYNFKF
jgi:hypothetical protein